MKLLYYLCIPLKWPFLIVGGIFYGIGMAIMWVGFWLHDTLEHRFWSVLHKRWCDEYFQKRRELDRIIP